MIMYLEKKAVATGKLELNKKFIVIRTPQVSELGFTRANYDILLYKVPQQIGGNDCGFFCLKYIEYFLEDPLVFIGKMVVRYKHHRSIACIQVIDCPLVCRLHWPGTHQRHYKNAHCCQGGY
jgi:hypothetical protein